MCCVCDAVLRSPPSPSFFKSTVYQRDSSPPQQVPVYIHGATPGPFLTLITTVARALMFIYLYCRNWMICFLWFYLLVGTLFTIELLWFIERCTTQYDTIRCDVLNIVRDINHILYSTHCSSDIFGYENNFLFQFQLSYGDLISITVLILVVKEF